MQQYTKQRCAYRAKSLFYPYSLDSSQRCSDYIDNTFPLASTVDLTNKRLLLVQVYGNRRSGVARRRSGFFSRLGSRLLKRMGSVGNMATHGVANLGTMATSQVARMGALASDGVARIGEMATDGVSRVSEMATDIADVAAAVPKGVASVANSEKVLPLNPSRNSQSFSGF